MGASEYSAFMGFDLSSYTGQWIAIVDKKIVASGENAKKTYDEAKKKAKDKKIFITIVPEKETMIL